MAIPAVDMHCHLDLYSDPVSRVAAIARSGAYVLSVTTTPKAWTKTVALAAGHPRIKTGLGLHPQLVGERRAEVSLFDRLLGETRYVGEVGLDGAAEYQSFWPEQVQVFDHVLSSCVRVGGRILTLHSRNAATQVLDALERHEGYGVAVLHWFSGTQRELSRAIEMGCWFSVGSAMLRGRKGRELLAKMRPERVLTETDGPFGMKGKVPLEPAECDAAIAVLSDVWGIGSDAVRLKIMDSFKSLVSPSI